MPVYPRLLLTALSSGSGKTTVACALLQAAADRGLNPAAFRCGIAGGSDLYQKIPDVKSRTLDAYLAAPETLGSLLYWDAAPSQLAVLDGSAGFYDGIRGTDRASTWQIARQTETPAVLVLCPPASSSLTLAAQVQGLLQFRTPPCLQGIFFNCCSHAQFKLLAPLLEQETGLPCIGYLPILEPPQCQNPAALARQLRQTGNVQRLLQIAAAAKPLEPPPLVRQTLTQKAPRIAVARDALFHAAPYENLEMLEKLGAKLCLFSPQNDALLPPCEGLYLSGGQLTSGAAALSRNISMRESIRRAVLDGLPTLAEGDGFLYLGQSLAGAAQPLPMAGVLPGRGTIAQRPQTGYARMTVWQDTFLCRRGSTFPVFVPEGADTDARGADLLLLPEGGSEWTCGFAGASLFACFAQLYFPAYPPLAAHFVQAAAKRIRTE